MSNTHQSRLAELRAMLEARTKLNEDGKLVSLPGYRKNVEAIRQEIARMERHKP